MKLAASSLQADLRDIERAVTTGTREAGRGRKTELRRQAAQLLIRGKVRGRRCRLAFRDCGAGRGGG